MMNKLNYISISVLLVSATMVFNSCDASKKVVSEPIAEVVVVEEVVNETKSDTNVGIKVVYGTKVIAQNDSITEVEEVIEDEVEEIYFSN